MVLRRKLLPRIPRPINNINALFMKERANASKAHGSKMEKREPGLQPNPSSLLLAWTSPGTATGRCEGNKGITGTEKGRGRRGRRGGGEGRTGEGKIGRKHPRRPPLRIVSGLSPRRTAGDETEEKMGGKWEKKNRKRKSNRMRTLRPFLSESFYRDYFSFSLLYEYSLELALRRLFPTMQGVFDIKIVTIALFWTPVVWV